MIETHLILTSESVATEAAALLASGLLVRAEGRIVPADNTTVYSPIEPGLDSKPSCFLRFQTEDQATSDAIVAILGADNINRASAPLRMLAGSLQPKQESWPRWAIKFGLTLGGYRQDWETAINTLSGAPDATNAAKLLPDRWAENDWLTLDEPWVNRIINQMKTSLGWTAVQRNQFVKQLKNRATAQVAAANE